MENSTNVWIRADISQRTKDSSVTFFLFHYNLLTKVLVTLHLRMGFDGCRLSGFAGAALYAATVGATVAVVRQDAVSSVTGTTAMTVRTHLPEIAAVTLAEVALSEYDEVARLRLQHLADGEIVRTLPD